MPFSSRVLNDNTSKRILSKRIRCRLSGSLSLFFLSLSLVRSSKYIIHASPDSIPKVIKRRLHSWRGILHALNRRWSDDRRGRETRREGKRERSISCRKMGRSFGVSFRNDREFILRFHVSTGDNSRMKVISKKPGTFDECIPLDKTILLDNLFALSDKFSDK